MKSHKTLKHTSLWKATLAKIGRVRTCKTTRVKLYSTQKYRNEPLDYAKLYRYG
jgi:hypothetical protein